MRVVLYTDDMEPITVLQLSDFAAGLLEKRGRVSVPIIEPVRYMPPAPDEKFGVNFRQVNIWAEAFMRNGVRHLFLFTNDEEAAMMLRSELLPGQHKEVQERERQAFARGFVQGLQAVLK